MVEYDLGTTIVAFIIGVFPFGICLGAIIERYCHNSYDHKRY